MKKNNQGQKTIFIYKEEFKTTKENTTEAELKEIFNKKYFNYIKRVENRFLGGLQNEESAL